MITLKYLITKLKSWLHHFTKKDSNYAIYYNFEIKVNLMYAQV